MTEKSRKPKIVWMEGLLTLFDASFPHEHDDPRSMGFRLGQQVVGLYIIEMLLKYALDDSGNSHGQHHNLHELLRNLSRPRRRAVERKYKEILNSESSWAWDVAETADALLRYLGNNAITDTRYFWEPDRTTRASMRRSYSRPGCSARSSTLWIVLHNYPSKPIVKRHDTTFVSLAESLKQDQQRLQSEQHAHTSN